MKRFHVHLGVPDLSASVRFYSDLFGMPPSVEKPDYAKWMLEDPRVNFAISHRGAHAGLNHLGLQAESAAELAGIRTRFEAADDDGIADEHEVSCCYARGNKHWLNDPQGIAWEAFHTLDSVPLFGGDTTAALPAACGTAAVQCCGPTTASVAQSRAERAGCCA
ncbi:MAG: ArsI/CadI family heavy metal resistance metalloenzyme [Betaproteobacteria bacterium]